MCVFCDAHKNSIKNETPSSLCAEFISLIMLLKWKIDLRTNIFAGYFHDVSDLFKKNEDCACQKSLAIRTDWGSFQIILACFAFNAILGHYTA